MSADTKKAWTAPSLEAIAMTATASKSPTGNEGDCANRNPTQTGQCS